MMNERMEYKKNLNTKAVKKINETLYLLSHHILDIGSQCESNIELCKSLQDLQKNNLMKEIKLMTVMIDIASFEAIDLKKPETAMEMTLQVSY